MSFTVAMDVTKSDGFTKSYTSRQGESNDKINIRIYDNGLLIPLSNITSAKLLAETPNGHYLEIEAQKSGDCIQITTTSSMNSEFGQFRRFYLKITLISGKVVTTPDLIYFVLPDANFTGGDAEDYIDRVEKLIEQMKEKLTETLEVFDTAVKELNDMQNQAINEMNQNFTAAQERIVELDIQISALRDQIEQALTDFESGNFWTKEESFNKEESKANVIYQVIGKEKVRIKLILDYKDKLAGSESENPHSLSFMAASDFLTPSQFPKDADVDYPKVYELDEALQTSSTVENGSMIQGCQKYNVLEYLKRNLGEQFFLLKGAKTKDQQVALVQTIVKSINYNVWVKGSDGNTGVVRNWVGFKIWFNGSRWTTNTPSNSTDTIKQLTQSSDPAQGTSRYIDSDGWCYGLVYANKSNGTIPSTVSMDYGNLEVEIEVSAHDFINSMIAQYSGKNFEPATPEEIIVGERDDVVVTPKGLKDATESTVPFKEYFGTGKQTENISGTRDASFAVGDSLGVSPNAEGKRPYTINSDGTLTLTRPAKLKITMTHKLVSGTATPSLYHYVYITDVTKLPSGFSGDDVEISSTGSTLATNGTLNYNWINSGTRVWDLPVGFVIKPSVRVQDANKAVRWIQCLGMTIEEVPTPNTKGLNISALADNPVIRLNDVTALLESERTKLGKQMVWGENHQVEDPATPSFGAVYASTDNEYKTIPATENYFTYDSKGLIVVAKDGQYKVSANVKRQWRTSVALWHYVSLMLNRGGSISKWDFSPFGGTTQNRNRQQCQAIITLKAGDTIYFTSESNNSTNALQFLNIDQFTMERLGD